MNDIRLKQLQKWLAQYPELDGFELTPASADASFRRYFRVMLNESSSAQSYIVMDAPPEKENSVPFVAIAQILFNAGINVPEIVQCDYESGFFLISDLGEEQYLSALNIDSFENLYKSAIQVLIKLQSILGKQLTKIPDYDKKLLQQEMALFRDWYLDRHLDKKLDSIQQTLLTETFAVLQESAMKQQQVLVHRDYHSRNLMTNISAPEYPGVLDFQDAVIGPVTYDLVSLLRDCYISWPEDNVIELALFYKKIAEQHKIISSIDDDQFLKYFDLMGIQRHLKAIGIFSRLNYRDNKPSYLDDIPRTLNYVKMVSAKYNELKEFNQFLNTLDA
ncbi:MAG: aminoglycoside phosphotransferase family protein [Gammaproteobacteria bacterium]